MLQLFRVWEVETPGFSLFFFAPQKMSSFQGRYAKGYGHVMTMMMWHGLIVRKYWAWGLHTPMASQRSPILNQIHRDVWDYSHRRHLNPLTSCPLMSSLVSVGVSVKCMRNNSRMKARETRRRNGTCCEGRGVNDRLVGEVEKEDERWGERPSRVCL